MVHSAARRVMPGLGPEVLGYDSAKAWTITRHAGPVLRSKAAPDAQWAHWERLLPRYAQAQLSLAEDRKQEFPVRAWLLELLEP
jgi:hypothetical protein